MASMKLQSVAEDLLMQSSATRVVVMDCISSGISDGNCGVVAEAVTHEAHQLRHVRPVPALVDAAAIESLSRTGSRLVFDDLQPSSNQAGAQLLNGHGVRSQALFPIHVHGKLRGVVVLHDDKPRQWSSTDHELAAAAALDAARELDQQDREALACRLDDLRDAAIQSILDQLRKQMDVQRCTFRQDVSRQVVFPVTHESRSQDTRSLLGDLTIVLNGQPVIEQMTRLHAQVVQNDTSTASAEPQFHRMLRHYGNMRAQIVTPLIKDKRLVGAVSAHDLNRTREWSSEEKAFAQEASRLLGLVAGLNQDWP